MTARVSTIRKWIKQGQDRGAAYLITWYDPLDREDYPTFHNTAEDVVARKMDIEDDCSIDEIYDLNGDIEAQLSDRLRHYAI